MDYTSQLFNYMKENAMGPKPGRWGRRQSGKVDPSIYAEPDMLLSQVSGYWKKPLAAFLKFFRKNPKASVDQIVKGTNLSKYEVDTLFKLKDFNLLD
jgi:hypothetical protein